MKKRINKQNDVLTKKYFDEKLKSFATKDDLQKFATKDDLQKFATKDDLQKFATKDDLQKFATKDDIRNLRRELDIQLIQTKLDVNQQIRSTERYLDHRVNTIEKKLNDFMTEFHKLKDWMYNKLDWLVKAYTKYEDEYTIMSNRYTEIDDSLENHETRITDLEKKSAYKTS